MSRDPLGLWGDPGQMGNGQQYCGNNPVNSTDPFGDLSTTTSAAPAVGGGASTSGGGGGGATTSGGGISLAGLLKALAKVLGGLTTSSGTTETSNTGDTSTASGSKWTDYGRPTKVSVITVHTAGMSGRLGHTMLKVTYVNEEGCEIEIYYGFALVLDKIGEDTLMPGGVDHGRWEDWFGEGRIYDGSGVTDQELNLTDAQIAQIIKFLKELTDNPPNYTGYTNCASVVARKLKELGVIDDAPLTPRGLEGELDGSGNVRRPSPPPVSPPTRPTPPRGFPGAGGFVPLPR